MLWFLFTDINRLVWWQWDCLSRTCSQTQACCDWLIFCFQSQVAASPGSPSAADSSTLFNHTNWLTWTSRYNPEGRCFTSPQETQWPLVNKVHLVLYLHFWGTCTLLEYFHFPPIFTSTQPHVRGKYCTFYSTTFFL